MCRHPFKNPLADIEALQVLETVEQTSGGRGVAPRLELAQPDETRRAVGHCLGQQPVQSRSGRGVEATRNSLLDSSLGADQRVRAQPLDRCRRRQHGQCSPAFTHQPPRQVLVRARPLGLPIEPDFQAPRGLSGVVAVPVDRSQCLHVLLPGLSARRVRQERLDGNVELGADVLHHLGRNQLTWAQHTPGIAQRAELEREAELVLRTPSAGDVLEVVIGDSVWLARVCQFALATPSHVPAKAFREMRVLTRYRRTLIAQRSRVRNRVQKVLDRSGVRVGGVLSDVFGRNGRRILDGLAQGLDPDVILASLSHHVAHKLERLGDALRLELSTVERRVLCDLLGEHDALHERLQGLDRDIDSGLEPWRERITRLQTIPGIDRPSACAILAEIGPDHLDAFGCAERLAAWAGLCPGNDRSAGKRRSTRTRRGSKTLRAVLVECAHAAARTHGCQFRGYHKALMVRRGYKRAIVATAHKLLRVGARTTSGMTAAGSPDPEFQFCPDRPVAHRAQMRYM